MKRREEKEGEGEEGEEKVVEYFGLWRRREGRKRRRERRRKRTKWIWNRLSPGLGSPQSWCPNGCVDRMAAVKGRRCGLMSRLPAAIDSSPVLLNQKQYSHAHTPRVSLGQFMNMLATLFPMCTCIH